MTRAVSTPEGIVREGDFVRYHGSLTRFCGQILQVTHIGGGRLTLDTVWGALVRVRPSSVSPAPWPAGDGVDVAAAIHALAKAGIDCRVLAADLGVHRTTVARWTASKTRPNARNLAALRALVDELHREILAGMLLAGQGQDAALTTARDALTSDAKRADVGALAARLVADTEAYLRRPAG
jgi:hypothetical protein